MSNYDLKRQMYCNSKAEESRGISLASNLTKAVREISIDDNIWNVTWNGFTFSVRPYLCSALSFMHVPDIFDILCTYTVDSCDDFYVRLSDYKEKDYCSMFTSDENNVFDSILYQFNSQIPCIVRYLVGINNPNTIKRLMIIILKEFSCVYDEKGACVEFFDKDLCNTEAFSYYLSFYWVLQKSKKLQFLLSREMKILDFKTTLNKVCPETSLHYKYISGVISSSELQDKYTVIPDDGISVATKELYNLFSEDTKEYLDKRTLDLFKESTSVLRLSYGFYEFMRIMSCSYITMGFFEKQNKSYVKYVSEVKELKDLNKSLLADSKSAKSALKAITKERNNLSSKVNSLTSKLEVSEGNTQMLNLKSENLELKKRISLLEQTLACKDKTIAECKHTIRGQIKELKSLNARLVANCNEEECLTEEVVEIQEVSLDEMCELLKTKKIGVFGGFDAGSITEKFKDYGLCVKHIINDVTFDVGDLDCAIVLTTNIQHKTVRKLKSAYNGCFVYVNGTNIENMITSAFKELTKEV